MKDIGVNCTECFEDEGNKLVGLVEELLVLVGLLCDFCVSCRSGGDCRLSHEMGGEGVHDSDITLHILSETSDAVDGYIKSESRVMPLRGQLLDNGGQLGTLDHVHNDI